MSQPTDDPAAATPPPAARTALIAIGAGAVVLLIVLLLALRGEGSGGFPGSETLEKIVLTSQRVTEFEPIQVPAGKVGDWLLTKGFERYRVPAGLETLPVQGCAITEYGEQTIASLDLGGDRRRATVFLSGSAGVDLAPGNWEIFTLDDQKHPLAIAAESAQGVCFVISAPGRAEELRDWLTAQGVRLR